MEGETFMPLLSMIIVQLGFAIMDILSKLAMNSGMDPLIHVAYRQIFASASLVPFAYFMERKIRPKMTGKIFFHIFLSSVLVIPLTQITHYVGLKHATPTITAALFSTSPAITFVMAILVRLERFSLKSVVGLAKALGTVICVGGALLLTLYHGPLLGLAPSPIHWRYLQRTGANGSSTTEHVNLIMGPFMIMISATAYSLWFIFQTKVNQMYAAPYSCQALMSVMGSIQCSVAALFVSRRASDWSLFNTIRLVSVLHSGIICSALGLCLISWCMNKKGPVYVAVFEPLPLIFVALFSWGFLEEKWYLGKFLGSVLIIVGLYGVIWGTKREMMMSDEVRDNTKEDAEVEIKIHETPMFYLQSIDDKMLSYAIMDILAKVAMNSGMDPFVHVAYRQIVATATLVPFAYFMERKTRPKMTGKIFFHIFICSILGISLTQITYYVGLKYATPTIATALFSTSPAITFIMATLFRQERLRLKSKVGQANAFGTIICVGGALILTLYHGPTLSISPSPIHWRYAQRIGANNSSNHHKNLLLGPLLLIISPTAFSLWLIVQTKVNQMYKAPYSIQALMSVMGGIQCTVVALCVSDRASDWSLAITIRLVSVLHSGIISSALAYSLISWCVNKKGPVYVAVFSPLSLVFVAIFSWGLLEEKWYLGKVLGSVLIVLGLYGVIWGTQRDNSKDDAEVEESTKNEIIKPQCVENQ